MEAKKPSVDLKGDIGPAFQLRRYAWSAKLPLSILTDFEEFAVYDCRSKPVKTDKSSTARTVYFTFDQYVDRWEEIASIFAHDAILKGSFDKYAESTKAKRGTAEVDNAFLKEIESWRQALARNIALRNPNLSTRELNYAVQQIIDRIIFLRICEDRGVEQYGRLMSHLNGSEVYKRLFKLFRDADTRYNSGLFHFEHEKDRPEEPDELTPALVIDDKPLKDIIKNLYYPESPYEFSVLPADILGQVYEQFLGKVIRLTPGHHAVIEDKPEVKKAGGVYYTPTYIVDYIVNNTVGKLLENKTPRQAAKLKILDPACGSGSFLIGAYQYLMDWHRNWYMDNNPKKHAKKGILYEASSPSPSQLSSLRRSAATEAISASPSPLMDSTSSPQAGEGRGEGAGIDWRLTTPEKKRILTNNIYGVDIDSQAVEVTKLSLLLKVLEGETQLSLFRERALPDLGNNIKCGNSLIGTDFYEGQQIGMFNEEERYRINAFDWEKEFPEIMKNGGFDAVIGNPPYVLGRETFDIEVKQYLSTNYSAFGGKFDLYIYFTEKAISLLRKLGRLGFILPNTILANENAENLRKIILERMSIKIIKVFSFRVFDKAQVESIILIAENQMDTDRSTILIESDKVSHVPQALFKRASNSRFDIYADPLTEGIMGSILLESISLGNLTDICIGIQLGGSSGRATKESFLSGKREDETYQKVIDGRDINRFQKNWRGVYVRYGNWLHRKRNTKYFENPKIVIRQIGRVPVATYDDDQFYTLNTIYNLINLSDYSLKYLLGIINSRLGAWFWQKKNYDFKTLFPKIKKTQIKGIPIRTIDFSDSTDKARHNQLVNLVEQILSLHKQQAAAKTPNNKTAIQRQIDMTDHRIDQQVYELYGLTEEEIKIVESYVK